MKQLIKTNQLVINTEKKQAGEHQNKLFHLSIIQIHLLLRRENIREENGSHCEER